MHEPDFGTVFDKEPAEDFILTKPLPAKRHPFQVLNVVVNNGNVRQSDAKSFFEVENWWDLHALRVEPDTDMTTLVWKLGLFESKGQARKAGFQGPIPGGLSEILIKRSATWIIIFNPTEP